MVRKPIYTPPGFDRRSLLLSLNHGGLRDPGASEYRRKRFRTNPLLFSLYYFEDSMRSAQTQGRISLSQFHVDFYRRAQLLIRKDLLPGEERVVWIAPRGAAKTTSFKNACTWAAAYLHQPFIAMFGNAAPDVQVNLLAGMKQQFATNERLRRDFPELCRPVLNRADMYVAESGAILTAKGFDTSSLGLNYNNQRPTMLVIDDPEPDAANYDATTKEKRLEVIQSKLLPMTPEAAVWWSATTTNYGSLAHDLVRSATGEQVAEWVRELGFTARYYPALVVGGDGREESWWPERWTTEQLQEIRARSPRLYAMNFANNPVSSDSNYWRPELFVVNPNLRIERYEMWIDPAVTAKKTSDYTAIAVLGLDVSRRKVSVVYAQAFHFTPERTVAKVVQILEKNPRVRDVYLEDNQGKDLWRPILEPALRRLGARLHLYHSDVKKAARLDAGLYRYEQGQVVHAARHVALEEQMLAYNPTAKNLHDDLADIVSTGIERMLGNLP